MCKTICEVTKNKKHFFYTFLDLSWQKKWITGTVTAIFQFITSNYNKNFKFDKITNTWPQHTLDINLTYHTDYLITVIGNEKY